MVLDSPGIIKSLCEVDLTNFPFDNQVCKFSFTTQNVPDDLVHLEVRDYYKHLMIYWIGFYDGTGIQNKY